MRYSLTSLSCSVLEQANAKAWLHLARLQARSFACVVALRSKSIPSPQPAIQS